MKKHLLMLLVAAMATTMSLEAQTIVIDDGFENGIQDSVWTQEFVSGNTAWSVESKEDGLQWPETVVQGSKRAYLRNTTGETQGYVTRLVSKVMDLSPRKVYQPELTFWYANPKWGTDRDTLRVLYRTSPNAKWKQLAEYSTAMPNWQKVKIENLPELGPTYQIAFEGKDNLGRGIVLDSVKLRSAPECTVPSRIVVTNKGADRVNISWAASFDAMQFELIVSKDTIDPYEVDNVDPELIAYHGFISGFYRNYDLTLVSGEYYYVYVRSICENEISLWSSENSENGAYRFRVRATKQVPYSCDFNYPSTQSQDLEWTWGNNTGKANPYVNSKQSQSQRAYYALDKSPAVIFSGGTNPTTVIPAGKYVYLATPALADTTNADFHLNQCQVHFWSTVYIYTGRQYGRSLVVGVMEDPDDVTSFVPVDTVTIWGNKTFQENIVDLGSYNGSGMCVAFMSDFDRQNLFYIDDVSIEYRPAVNKVTKISVNPRDTYATISWEGNASSYNVLITNAEVDPSNPSEDAIVDRATVSTNSYRCEALEEDHSWNRPYYVYVQAEGTEWSYRYPFVTIASQRAIPYTFDMETASGRYKIGTANTYYAAGLGMFSNSQSYPSLYKGNSYKGAQCLYLNKTAGADAWITLPMVEKLDSTQVKFFLSGGTNYAKAHASIGVMTNPMDINTFTKITDFSLSTTGYTMCYANFINYTGEDGVIAIVWDDVRAMTENTLNYIDEIRVEELAECVPPANLSMDVLADSITLRWDESQNQTWEVLVTTLPLTTIEKDTTFAKLSLLNKVAFADTLYWDDVTLAPEFGIGGLASQTDYYLYVRTVCAGDNAWWTEKTFHTPCPDADFPFKETFESYSSASGLGCWQLMDYLGTNYPMIYSVGGKNGKTLELYSTGTTHRNVAIMPNIDGNLSDMMLSFETRSYSSSNTSTSVLYVGTMGDINDRNSFIPFDTIYNTGGTEFQKVRLILSDYNLAYNNIAFSSGLGATVTASDVLIDNVELKDATCLEPFDFRATHVQSNSVDFTWGGISPNDQWGIRVSAPNVSVDTVVTGKSFHLDGLQPVTNYTINIRALCGDSTWVAITVQTACEKMDPNEPNKETFESYPSGTSYGTNYQAQCWTVGNGNPDATTDYIPYIYKDASYASSGTNTYRLYGSYSYDWWSYDYEYYTPAYVASPEIDCTHMKDLVITFNMYASTYYTWLCGVMSDPNDLSTFVVLDSVKGTGESVQYMYDLSEYEEMIPSDARYFAWRTPYEASSYAYLDDVSILRMKCPLTKPTYAELTAQSVRISGGLRVDGDWALIVANRRIPTDSLAYDSYKIPDSILVYSDTINVRSTRVTRLNEQTKYYAYTASLCDDGTSPWSELSFTTLCLPMTPEALGTVTFSAEQGFVTGQEGELPCWTVGNKTTAASQSYIPYVEGEESYKHNGNNYLRLADQVSGSDESATRIVGAYAVMPTLNVDSISKYQVNLWARGYSGVSQIIVGIASDPADLNTFLAVDTLVLSTTEWAPYNVSFEEYEGDYLGRMGKSIMFLSDFGASNTVFLSEISVELTPSCRPLSSFKVESVGEDSAVIRWKGYQDRYRVLLATEPVEEADKADYEWLLDSLVTSSENVAIRNLKSATNYYVYAQGICGEGDSTTISLQYASFKTTCPTTGGVPLPYYEDFLAYTSDDVDPGCWVFRGSSYTHIHSLTQNSKTYHAIDLYTSGSSNHGWMVAPLIDAPLEDLQLTFDARTYGSAAATLYVGTMNDPEDPTTFVAFDTIAITQETFLNYQLNLGDYDLTYDRLAFTSGFGTLSSDLYITNIGLVMLSPCHAPKIKSNGATFNSVELQITPAKEENDLWDIVVIEDSIFNKIRNLNRYLDTVSTRMSVNTTNVTIQNLKPATSYYIYARTQCGDVYGNSAWSKEPLKVHTQFYFKDSYFFGFEKSERWERSQYASNDGYYIHPALVADRDTLGLPSTTYYYYPYSIENTPIFLYSHTGTGALTMYATGNYHGAYVIFPYVDEPSARSFDFQIRQNYISALINQTTIASEGGVLEIGTIEKNKSYDTYEPMVTIRLGRMNPNEVASEENNYLFSHFTLDLDEETVANKQIVLHMPKQPFATVSLYVDNVSLEEAKGYSLVSLNRVVPSGNSALVKWANVGGPWNLFIYDQEGNIVNQYLNLNGVTSQLVEGLQPSTNYTATLEAANAPEKTDYVLSSSLNFTTFCLPLEPDENGAFTWDFNDASEWEANDVLSGVADSLYLKPACFHTGITYDQPVNGYQWLVQRKGYEATGALTGYSATRYLEVGRNDSHALRVHTEEQHFNSYLVLPELHAGLDTMMIEFYGRCFVNYPDNVASAADQGRTYDVRYLAPEYSKSIVVGTLSDPNDFSTLQILDTLTYKQTNLTTSDNVNDDPAGLRYWELMQLPLTEAQNKFIVLFQTGPGLFFLDDLSIKPIGNTLFEPRNPQTGAVSTTTASFSWTPRNPEVRSVVVVLNADGEEVLRDTVTASSHVAQGLEPGKAYKWFVYQSDGVNNSQATAPLTFETECVAISTAYTSGFEQEEGWSFIPVNTTSLSTSFISTICWTYADAQMDAADWKTTSGHATNMTNTELILYSHTGASAVLLRGSASSRPYIAMPEMDVNTYDTTEVSFWIRPATISASTGKVSTSYTGTSYSKSVIVGTMTDPADASTFVAIDTVTFEGTLSSANTATEANNYLFQQKKVALIGATGPYIAFMASDYAKGATSRQNLDYIYLDDVEFVRINDCKQPTALSNDKVGGDFAVLSWTGTAGEYLLQVSRDPYFAEDEDFAFNDTVYAESYSLQNLMTQTTYYWRVKGLCGGRFAESDFSSNETFTTFRTPYYMEPFTAASATDWIFCNTHADVVVDSTSLLGSTDNSYGFKRVNNTYGLTGPHYTSVGYLSDYNWMVSPAFYISENDSVQFSMDLALTACNASHQATSSPALSSDMKNDYYFMIIVSEDGGKTWKSRNILAKWQNTNPAGSQLRDIPSTGMNVRYSLAQYAGKSIRIGLYREAKSSSSTGIAIHVDNFRLAYFDKVVETASGCQYEDIQVGDIYLSGDNTEPGVHVFSSSTYASDDDAMEGQHDIVYSLEVQVYPSMETLLTDTICEGETYSDLNFHGKDQTGVYRSKRQSVHGCDSVITLNLTVSPRMYAENLRVEICAGESYMWNGKPYTRAGLYRDTLVSSLGCDSVETLIVAYAASEDTIFASSRIELAELPFTYINDQHPYVMGQAPIYYAAGTPMGTYTDTVMVQGTECSAVLVHTLTIYDRHEAIDLINDPDAHGAQKVIVRDQMYIILNDEWYTPAGQKVADPRQ